MNYINGQWVEADSGEVLKVVNPATLELVKEVSYGGKIEAEKAVNAAKQAFKRWKKLTGIERAEIMKKAADYMKESAQEIAETMTREMGKPIKEAYGEVINAADFVEWFAEEAKRVFGDVVPAAKTNKHLMVLRQPIGVVAAITPWNFPVSMITRKIAPAIAAGCTVILKPSPESPLSAMKVFECFHKAGFPEGVVNLVIGDAEEVGDVFLSSKDVKKITFTGSTAVGKHLIRGSADTVKKVSMELGGHAPFIVFADADIDAAVHGALRTKFRNCGQTCINTNRIYVHEDVVEEFAEKFGKAVKDLSIGNGLEESVDVGPLVSENAVAKVEAQVEDAKQRGGEVITGGKRIAVDGMKGYFYEPTVIKNAKDDMLITNEETFGPVAPIYTFKDDEEALEKANDTDYGLASYFYTTNMKRVHHILEDLEYGIIGVNDPSPVVVQGPFGGIKESGIGSEGGRHGINEFLVEKFVSIDLN